MTQMIPNEYEKSLVDTARARMLPAGGFSDNQTL